MRQPVGHDGGDRPPDREPQLRPMFQNFRPERFPWDRGAAHCELQTQRPTAGSWPRTLPPRESESCCGRVGIAPASGRMELFDAPHVVFVEPEVERGDILLKPLEA